MHIQAKINLDFLLLLYVKYSILFALIYLALFSLNISWKSFHSVHTKLSLSFLLLPGIFLYSFTVIYLPAPLLNI